MSTEESMADRLYRWATWKSTLTALVGVVLIQAFFAGYLVPSIKDRRPEAVESGALVMVDTKPLIAPDEARAVFRLYSDASALA